MEAKDRNSTQSTGTLTFTVIVIIIAILSLIVSLGGVLNHSMGSYDTTESIRGVEYEYLTAGIYKYSYRSFMAEEVGRDFLNLVVGIPLLVVFLLMARRGSLQGKLLLIGMLFSFFYQYILYSVGIAFNQFFLLYVLIFSLSLVAMLLVFLSIDQLKFPKKLPTIGILIIIVSMGIIALVFDVLPVISPMINGTTPAEIGGNTTMAPQAIDLGFLLPISLVGVIFVIKKNPLGYCSAVVLMVMFFRLTLGFSTMTVTAEVLGVHSISSGEYVEIIVFTILTIGSVLMTRELLKPIKSAKRE